MSSFYVTEVKNETEVARAPVFVVSNTIAKQYSGTSIRSRQVSICEIQILSLYGLDECTICPRALLGTGDSNSIWSIETLQLC